MRRVAGLFGLMMLAPTLTAAAPVEVISQQDLEKRVSRLERMLENPVLLQLSDRLAEQQKEIQSMQDRIDRLNYRLRQQEKIFQQRLSALQARIEDLERQRQTQQQAEPATEPGEPAPDDAAPVAAPEADEQALAKAYDAAMTLLRKAKYPEAARAFDAFVKQHPKAKLAPNAAYWAGETYMVQLDFKRALARFDTVINTYPASSKYHDSLYRSAEALYKLGKKQQAVARLRQLAKDPKAPEKLKQRARALLERWDGR